MNLVTNDLSAANINPRARIRFTRRGWYRFSFRWIRRAHCQPEDVWVGPFASYADALKGYVPAS